MTPTTVQVRPNGPYIVTGDFSLNAQGGPRDKASVVLCRCGQSSNKPYCDGTHKRIGFVDAGIVLMTTEPDRTFGRGPLAIVPQQNGPLELVGPVLLSGADGSSCESHDIYLCRCGGSATKPFCDGTHSTNGFAAAGSAA